MESISNVVIDTRPMMTKNKPAAAIQLRNRSLCYFVLHNICARHALTTAYYDGIDIYFAFVR
jgi:hypothetical protein